MFSQPRISKVDKEPYEHKHVISCSPSVLNKLLCLAQDSSVRPCVQPVEEIVMGCVLEQVHVLDILSVTSMNRNGCSLHQVYFSVLFA